MELTTKDINRCPELEKQARTLYLSSFPKEERIPWWLLRLNSRRKGIDLTAFLEGETFCGFTASVSVEGLHFILFLAVEEDQRRKGIGSAILQKLKAQHRCINLNVETLDTAAPNFPERERRFAFYRKNGFFDTGWHVWEVGGMFRILSTVPELDVAAYRRIFRKLTLGVWKVRLEKAEI